MGYRRQDLGGVKTVVKDTNPGGGSTTPGVDSRKPQALPSPQWTNTTRTGPHNFNTPGPSGTGQDGKSIHKDKARTQGKPGGDHPGSKGGPSQLGPSIHTRRPGVYADDEGGKEAYDDIMPSESEILSVLRRMEAQGKEAAIQGKPYPGSDRQKKQRGQAKRYFQKWYRKNKGKVRTRMKKWYNRFKNRGRYKKDQERREDHPERFERRPGGARSIKERSKDYRENKKKNPQKKAEALLRPVSMYHIPSQDWGVIVGVSQMTGQVTFQVGGMYQSRPLEEFFEESVVDDDYFFDYLDKVLDFDLEDELDGSIPEIGDDEEAMLRLSFQVKYRSNNRQVRQKGQAKLRAKRYYLKNRMKARQRSRKRYKKLRRLPSFKKQQKIRRKHPERFKRKLAQVLTVPDIAFVIGEQMDLGYVRGLSPMTGLVTYYRVAEEGNNAWLESLPVPTFLAAVGFLSEQDADAMFELIDTELEEDPYEGLDQEGLLASAALEGIDCDSEEFRALCQMLTGEGRLDHMSPSQLLEVDSVIVNQMVYDSEGPYRENAYKQKAVDPYLIDPQDDDYLHGVVYLEEDYAHLLSKRHIARKAEMLYRKVDRGDAGAKYDRAVDRKELKGPRSPGVETLDYLSPVTDNPGSAKVIPEGHDFVNKGEKKFAYRISDIMANVDGDLKVKAQGLPTKIRKVDPKNNLWLFDVRGKSGTYRVKIKGQLRGAARKLSKADVFVSCSCPHWRWQGPEHWAAKNGYLLGDPRGTASYPVIMDPDHDHGVCKHVLAVFNKALKYDWDVPTANRGKRSSLRFLSDILNSGEMPEGLDRSASLVAQRYIEQED